MSIVLTTFLLIANQRAGRLRVALATDHCWTKLLVNELWLGDLRLNKLLVNELHLNDLRLDGPPMNGQHADELVLTIDWGLNLNLPSAIALFDDESSWPSSALGDRLGDDTRWRGYSRYKCEEDTRRRYEKEIQEEDTRYKTILEKIRRRIF